MTHRTKLSTALSIERNRRGLSQVDMAKLIGVHVTTYAFWEIDRYMPHVDHLATLATALDLTVTYDRHTGWHLNARPE